MKYHMVVRDIEETKTYLRTEYGISEKNMVDLVVGNLYEIYIVKPTNKRDQFNNGRMVELLGFDSGFSGTPIVRYLDTNRRGRACINELKPLEYEIVK